MFQHVFLAFVDALNFDPWCFDQCNAMRDLVSDHVNGIGPQLFQLLGEMLSYYNGKWIFKPPFWSQKLQKAEILTEHFYDFQGYLR